jgi:hypothetical protein
MRIRTVSFLGGVFAIAVIAFGVYAYLSGAREEPRGEAGARRAGAEQPTLLRYDREYPAVGYSTRAPDDAVSRLQQRIDRGEAALEFDVARGYLDSLLAALGIGVDSQMLVFSKTSVQARQINARTPRAIYFSDDVYVGWVRGANTLEVAAMDPNLGPVFFTLAQDRSSPARFERQMGQCLRCHDSYSLTGGGVPRFITGSGYTNTEGDLVSHEGWILTSDRTPLRSRWGGWYVSGYHGDQVHLGNIAVKDPAELQSLDELRIGNLENLDSVLDTSAYPGDTSDIVALLVLEHQVQVQNAIARANYDAVSAQAGAGLDAAAAAAIAEPLAESLLLAGEAPLTGRIESTSGFAASFQARGPRDSLGRSLRELNLRERLFEYPLSYLIYSAAFDALPAPVKSQVYMRLREILGGEDRGGVYVHLSAAERRAIGEILMQTKPDFAAVP